MKRLAFYTFWEKNGIVRKYVLTYLKGLQEVADRIIVIANGNLSKEGKETRMLSAAHIKSLSLGFNVENAFLITNYSGSDPEVTSYDAVFEQGVDFYTYPKPRTYSFTLGVNF